MGRRRGKVRAGLGSWRGREEKVGTMPRKGADMATGTRTENHNELSRHCPSKPQFLHLYNGDRMPSLKGQEENEGCICLVYPEP